jgi:hypothetical protein
MSYEHNLMAHNVSAHLLQELRASRAAWANGELSARTTLWQGMADWPRPDIAFQDTSKNASIAFEFKPPNQPKREYVTGMGQALTYLNDFKYSALVLPAVANDGFKIAEYINKMFTDHLATMPVAIFEYSDDPTQLKVIRKLQNRPTTTVSIPAGTGRKLFWGYWRDLSNHDLLEMLRLADGQKRPDFKTIFDKFWARFATKGKARTWENTKRKAKAQSAAGKMGERINAHLAMKHSGLLDSDDRLTADGYKLLHIGKVYGPQSAAFLDALACQVLITARHLELILWIEEQQRVISANSKRNAQQFYRAVDRKLERAGVIVAPARGAAKGIFLRDEPKLWNKLGLLKPAGKGRYFHIGHGLVFDWRRIISVVESK